MPWVASFQSFQPFEIIIMHPPIYVFIPTNPLSFSPSPSLEFLFSAIIVSPRPHQPLYFSNK
ncbi:hypothetical protein GIB67_040900 [Kingdonia uniflora]|uniref:Uncharacterized protein n=1 Tax=Kingdonia uniflora TaxID=39325 RepID=A0A7J7L8A1_9MAGN|nr:hypothetical protein GIB67_040900 [Kingdonia uniflora]